MLINTNLTQLSRNEIVYLLEEAGYNESSADIIKTSFKKVCENSNIQYMIEYFDINDQQRIDHVYVFIDSNGKLTADY